ncbi:hypothetical protein CR920_06490 [Stenotrophomonas indicatrix]|nr:hypothetical protein CR920_06490 [Stenotrophomonas indicatrix]
MYGWRASSRASVEQGKRYAERGCAARLYPEMRLRAAVARMVGDTPSEALPPPSCLPPTPAQLQQARRLAGMGLQERRPGLIASGKEASRD